MTPVDLGDFKFKISEAGRHYFYFLSTYAADAYVFKCTRDKLNDFER